MKLNRILSKDDVELALMEYGNYVARYLKPKTKYVGGFKYRLNPDTGRYERRYRNDCGETIRVWIDGLEEDAPILPPFDEDALYEKEGTRIVGGIEYRLNPTTGSRERSSRDLFGERVRDEPDDSEKDAPILPPFDDVARYEKEKTKIVNGLEYRLNPQNGRLRALGLEPLREEVLRPA